MHVSNILKLQQVTLVQHCAPDCTAGVLQVYELVKQGFAWACCAGELNKHYNSAQKQRFSAVRSRDGYRKLVEHLLQHYHCLYATPAWNIFAVGVTDVVPAMVKSVNVVGFTYENTFVQSGEAFNTFALYTSNV
jgi:hypothetical protein